MTITLRRALWAGWLASILLPAARADETVMVVFEPRRKAMLSAEVASVVRRLHKELGQTIEQGELLLLLDDTVFRARLQMAQARLLTARARLAAAQKLLEIDAQAAEIVRARAVLAGAQAQRKAQEKLFADNSLSQAAVEAARMDAAVAAANLELALKKRVAEARELAIERASVQTAEAEERLARREIEACRIVAPFAGRVSRVPIHAHEVTQTGQHLIEVVDDRTLLAGFLAPSRLVFRLARGQTVRIRVQETGKLLDGEALLGGLWLERPAGSGWSAHELSLLQLLLAAYAAAWARLRGGRLRRWAGARRRWLLFAAPIAAALLYGLFGVPLHLKVVAPCEVTPKDPYLVTAPLDGVVESLLVRPGQQVREGEPLLRFDGRVARQELEVARQQVAVVRSQLERATAQALQGKETEHELKILRNRLAQERTRLRLAEYTVSRLELRAPRAGVVQLSDPDAWRGKPVQVGEKVLVLVDPRRTRLRIWIPEDDQALRAQGQRGLLAVA